MDLTAETTIDGNRRDTGNALEALRQVVFRDFPQLHAIVVAFDSDAHDRRRARVELEHDGRVRFLRQPATHAIEAVADVVGGLVQVGAPRESSA